MKVPGETGHAGLGERLNLLLLLLVLLVILVLVILVLLIIWLDRLTLDGREEVQLDLFPNLPTKSCTEDPGMDPMLVLRAIRLLVILPWEGDPAAPPRGCAILPRVDPERMRVYIPDLRDDCNVM